MSAHERAGHAPEPSDLIDVDALLAAYHDEHPDPAEASQRVAFGTSGHRGSSLKRTFNDAHVIAIAAAVCRYREAQDIDGPLFLGRDDEVVSVGCELLGELEADAAGGAGDDGEGAGGVGGHGRGLPGGARDGNARRRGGTLGP